MRPVLSIVLATNAIRSNRVGIFPGSVIADEVSPPAIRIVVISGEHEEAFHFAYLPCIGTANGASTVLRNTT